MAKTIIAQVAFGVAVAAMLTVALVASVHAEPVVSPCKGKAETECKTNAACIWVNGYRTVAGQDRKGYCRVSTKKAR